MATINRSKLQNDLDDAAAARFNQRGEKGDDEGRLEYRRKLARANRAFLREDGQFVHERQIGQDDLLLVNFLERGLKASRAVCRIDIRDRYRNPVGNGTGFLVGPTVLMTNAHVLLDEDEGQYSLAEFNYEEDVFSLPRQRVAFSLQGLLMRDEDLDFALARVAPADIRGRRGLEEFGYLRLRPTSGKAVVGERVSIVQHPRGRTKAIAVRANTIVDVFEHFVHYEADTDRGSSGAPVFSDEWEIVALHHAGVKAVDDAGNILRRDGQPWDPNDGEDEIRWRANEGIRVHAIVRRIRERLEQMDVDRDERTDATLLRDVIREADVASGPYVLRRTDISEERRNAAWYAAAQGYDQDFLGPQARVPLPDYSQHQNNSSTVLSYRHFSVVMNVSRRQALFTACNIDGLELTPSSRSTSWKLDPRIEAAIQLDNDFYRDQDNRTNFLDRGHLVRRLDPAWGDIGIESIDDTFHWTNSALQHRNFNNGLWGRLEDALMARLNSRTILTVFTGPIFGRQDPELTITRDDGSVDVAQVPLEFWKVIAFADDDGYFATAAFRQPQGELVNAMNLDFETLRNPELRQVSITEIEEATGLGFHDLGDYEATPDQLEADRFPRKIVRRMEDLTIRGLRRGQRRTRLAARKTGKKTPRDANQAEPYQETTKRKR